MEKERPMPERKRVHLLKLNKETLRQLETAELQDAVGGYHTAGVSSCGIANPCPGV